MSWQDRFRLPEEARTTSTGLDRTKTWRRTDEVEVRRVLKGLSQRHGLTVGEVARNLESGLWSREHCLGAMRLQWTFEKMCDGEGFPPF